MQLPAAVVSMLCARFVAASIFRGKNHHCEMFWMAGQTENGFACCHNVLHLHWHSLHLLIVSFNRTTVTNRSLIRLLINFGDCFISIEKESELHKLRIARENDFLLDDGPEQKRPAKMPARFVDDNPCDEDKTRRVS